MSDLQVQEFLKHFENSESFNNFCFSRSKDYIRKMTTDDWTSFFYGVNYLSKKTGLSASEIVSKHTKALAYMYSNYRPNKIKSREIKKFAYQVADKLSTSKEFAKLYYDIDIAVWSSRYDDAKAARIMRDTIYREFIDNNFKAALLKPIVFIKKENNLKVQQAGYYRENIFLPHEIAVKSNVVDFCNVVAHELYHSLQHLGFMRRTKFLRKLGIKFSYDKKMAELYRLNQAYYLNYLNEGTPFQGYKKQPLEYDARLFATCFERRLRKNLRASENNWGLLYQTSQMLRSVGVFGKSMHYDETGISILCDLTDKVHAAFLDELRSKHLIGAQIFNSDGASSVLFIPRNAQNIIAINKLNTCSSKAYKENDIEKGFIKRFFPTTYNNFFASNEEKLMHQPTLGKVIINRLGENKDKR